MKSFKEYHKKELEEASAPIKWKRAGPNGEIEATVKGQRFKIEKALDHNLRHKGEFKIMVWDKRSEEWEWDNTVRGKTYAKELVMNKLDEAAANSVAGGGVDMNPTGKPKKMDKRSKYHIEKMFRRAQGSK